jgi:hypothetical protein
MTRDRILIDRATAAPWVEVAQSARLVGKVFEQLSGPTAGSQFDQADALYPMEPVSRWCQGYLAAALEHLTLWADYAAPLKFHKDHSIVHTLRPVQALARAATESAAQAVWVMAGGSARELAIRHLTLVYHDLDERRRAAPSDADRRTVADAQGELISQLAPVTDVSVIKSFPGYLQLVKRATQEVLDRGAQPDFVSSSLAAERVWRASAGSMHGKRWPDLELKTDVVVNGRTFRVPDPAAATQALKLANGLMTYGVYRFADYSGQVGDLPALFTAAMTELGTEITLIDGATLDLSRMRERLESALPPS